MVPRIGFYEIVEGLFKDEVGMTLQAYARQLRLHYGLWQVHMGGVPIFQAAENCGFVDAAHFGRVCVQIYGKRPTALSDAELRSIIERCGHRASRIAATGLHSC
ncbi:helix-turn-helix domain-containing protein [Achromobacter aloeverae]